MTKSVRLQWVGGAAYRAGEAVQPVYEFVGGFWRKRKSGGRVDRRSVRRRVSFIDQNAVRAQRNDQRAPVEKRRDQLTCKNLPDAGVVMDAHFRFVGFVAHQPLLFIYSDGGVSRTGRNGQFLPCAGAA